MINYEKNDPYTEGLLKGLFEPSKTGKSAIQDDAKQTAQNEYRRAIESNLTRPVIDFFLKLKEIKAKTGFTPTDLGFTVEQLKKLTKRHVEIDEHGVTVGGRLDQAIPIAEEAAERVKSYMDKKDVEAPSGIQLWDQICRNIDRIKNNLSISDDDWNSFSGQLKFAIDSTDVLAKVIDLPVNILEDVLRVTRTYRMRLTPYYASLIQPGNINDPVLLQSVPTGEMVDNVGEEIPPVAADHSPARLIDQFYPRVVTIKATNMCAMYCTHCLRIAHIGKKDRIYSQAAYDEALGYIRSDPLIRDVLITGGDAFILPNKMLGRILADLDDIEHVTVKRLGTRIPVTSPMRIDDELLDILEASNETKPIRVVTQINTAQEITPVSKEGFKKISRRVSAVMNQAVLLRGINDTKVKMWKLCETIQEAYVRPYYLFNCSFRNPQFAHMRVPVEVGRDIVESMYGNVSGDAIPRYIATAGGKVPLHRDNVIGRKENGVILRKPWSGEEVVYPDADQSEYENSKFAFAKYQ
jgi:lysine 2,3-aminomutase